MAHEAAYLPRVMPDLRRQLEQNGSLYSVLSSLYGVEIAKAEDTVGTMVAGPEDVRLLAIEMGAPLAAHPSTRFGCRRGASRVDSVSVQRRPLQILRTHSPLIGR